MATKDTSETTIKDASGTPDVLPRPDFDFPEKSGELRMSDGGKHTKST